MSEKVNDRTIFSLSEVALSIQKTLAERYTSSFWIKAEMNKLNHYPQSGHCYPDLVEKIDGKIVAEMRSTIWKDDFLRINENFQNVLHEPLKNGIKILFSAKISYNPLYGLSLRILEVDPSWSLGELEKEKQLTIEKLRKEGLFITNKSLILPLLPKRIAVISVETSKGYADFRNIIDNNDWGYSFFYMLFPALLQGENAVGSIMKQMERISLVKQHFDMVAIIRGGGGDIGLACYNNYELAKAIALFPLPVITGIGHSTNETVSEMVAFRNTITPTELADYLLQKFHNFSVPLRKAQDFVIDTFSRLLQNEKSAMLNLVRLFKSTTSSRLAKGKHEINSELKYIRQQSAYFLRRALEKNMLMNLSLIEKSGAVIKEQWSNIAIAEKSVELLNPMNVLNRGYSITMVDGEILKTVDSVREGAIVKTILSDGNVISIAQSVTKNENNG